MDQKDNGTHLKKLASAQELRGKNSGSGSAKGGKKKMWLSLLSLVVILGIAIGIYFVSGILKPETEPEETPVAESTTVKIVNRQRSEIASITVDLRDEEPYTVLNNNTYAEDGTANPLADGAKAYALDGLEDFDLDQDTASTLISYCANLTAVKLVTDSMANPADYGLDNPASTVTMSYRDGTSTVWLIGNQAPTSNNYYFSEKGSKAVFLLYSSAINSMTSTRNSLHTCEMPWSISDTTTITDLLIETEGKDPVEINYRDSSTANISVTTIQLVQPFVYAANADRSDEMFNGVAALDIASYAGELSELENTGLEDGAARIKVTVQVRPDANKPEEIVTHIFRIGNFASSNQVYAQIDETDAVYLTDASLVSFLDNATPGYLVDQFSNLVFITRVDEIDITTGKDSWSINIEREPKLDDAGNATDKTVDTFFFDGKQVDDEALFKKLYQEIIGTMNSKLCDDYDYDGDVYCSVKYTLNIEPGELLIEYLEYNDDYLAVRRDGLTLFLIKRDRVDDMITALEQYREGTYVAPN